MAYYGFTNKMVKGQKIQIFNYGDMFRDFTYVDDIVTGVVKVMAKAPEINEDGVNTRYITSVIITGNLMYFVEH